MPEICAADVCRLIEHSRLNLSHEKDTQADLAAILDGAGILYRREVRLSPGDIPDFLVGDGVAIEVKIKGAQKRSVYRQLCRYAEHDQVKAIVLATNLSMGLPPEINGKPTFYASLGKGWI